MATSVYKNRVRHDIPLYTLAYPLTSLGIEYHYVLRRLCYSRTVLARWTLMRKPLPRRSVQGVCHA
jgi:hypothetical protein